MGVQRDGAQQQDTSDSGDGDPAGRRPHLAAPALAAAADESLQVLRLAWFRRRHPHVIVGDFGFGALQARVPHPSGETVITRYSLRDLLDKLEQVVRPDG